MTPDAQCAGASGWSALTLERGAPDNVTVITVGIRETTLLNLNQPVHAVTT